jgi:putative ABC transport system ATP-binding protein
VRDLAKRYADSPVFDRVSLELQPGEIVAVLGESGVGKSTLLNIVAGLDTLDAGSVTIEGARIDTMSEREQAHFRRAHLGFVFQAFHVLPHLSVGHNVALPLLLLGRDEPARITEVLAAVGLQGFDERMPRTLSGGQMQRVAIARALVHRPRLVLADEPTGNLDPDTAERVLDVLAAQVRSQGAACLLATHSQHAAARADRVLRLTPHGVICADDHPHPGPLPRAGEGEGAHDPRPRAGEGVR